MEKKLTVTSHVSRDFLQNASYFNTLPKVIWEYVSNSLDNGRENTPLTIVVDINRDDDLVIIADNGTGMSRKDLERFFTMHGENENRKRGKRVRGRFGTGKSAAFGIAKSLRIETIQSGMKNIVSLHLDDIKSALDGKPFNVTDIEVNTPTSEDNGTIIKISELLIGKLEIENSISFIEKHLARYHLRANVIINSHICKFKEPPSIGEYIIKTPRDIEVFIGDPILTIKVAPFSLDPDERGVDILSDGIWHETTLGELEGRDFADRLFGEVDIPLLESVEDDIAPFDNTRNNLLNRANPRVVIIIGWISQELEKIRLELVKIDKEKKKNEQNQKLEQEAQRMASILNEDFQKLMLELDISKKISGKSRNNSGESNSSDGEVLPGGGDNPSEWQETGQPHGSGHVGFNPPGEGDIPRPGPTLIPGETQGSPKQIDINNKKRRSGSFSIEFANLTVEYPRSKYEREEHRILINLDHPQVTMALKEGGGSLDSRHFLSIVYEIASVEYAQTIPFERIQQGEQIDVGEALYSVGETIDRIARKFSIVLGL